MLSLSSNSAASMVEELIQDIKASSHHAMCNYDAQINKMLHEEPSLYHDPLFVAKSYNEDQLISNWNKLTHLLTEAGQLHPSYLEELKFQQERKKRKLKNLYSYMFPSQFPSHLVESAEYVAFSQVCSFENDENVSQEQIAEKYSISNSVLQRYQKNL